MVAVVELNLVRHGHPQYTVVRALRIVGLVVAVRVVGLGLGGGGAGACVRGLEGAGGAALAAGEELGLLAALVLGRVLLRAKAGEAHDARHLRGAVVLQAGGGGWGRKDGMD